jgi:hypothetical protein
MSQRTFATNHAVSEGIYPTKLSALEKPAPHHRSLVARLSFRLSQSDLNYNHEDGPRALVPDPSDLQEKQEERRNLLRRMARQRDADSRTEEMSITHTRQTMFPDKGDENEEADDDPSEGEDEYGYVPPIVSFYAQAMDGEESAITDACTWAESSMVSIGSRCTTGGTAARDSNILPLEVHAEEDNVSCLHDYSGSFRLPKHRSSVGYGNSITQQASSKSILGGSYLFGGSDPKMDKGVNDDDDGNDDNVPSVSLFHVSAVRTEASYPMMMSLSAKNVTILELSDGSLYLDEPGKPKAQDDDEAGDTMDEDFYLAEIVKALEAQNRKTKQVMRRKAKSKPSAQYLVEL